MSKPTPNPDLMPGAMSRRELLASHYGGRKFLLVTDIARAYIPLQRPRFSSASVGNLRERMKTISAANDDRGQQKGKTNESNRSNEPTP
jgi:hypothetical protein